MSYVPITDTDVTEMLKLIKSNSIDDLFDIVPDKFRLDYENLMFQIVIRSKKYLDI